MVKLPERGQNLFAKDCVGLLNISLHNTMDTADSWSDIYMRTG